MIIDCEFDVAVVGAGPTGLTLANFLGLSGLKTILIERNETTVQQPRAVSIDDETLRATQAAGLADKVMADTAQDYGLHYFGPDGVCFAKVEPTTREYGYPRRSAFSQPLFEATLRKGLARFESVTTLFGHTCEGVEEDANGVTLAVRSPAGDARSIRAAYVAAADGGRSLLRDVVGATLEGSTFEERWLIVDLGATRERLRQTRVLCDPGRPVICLPGPHGIRRYEFMLSADEREEEVTREVVVRAMLAAVGPDADAPLVRTQVYTFHARIADRWGSKRVFLGGDAAHLTPPFAGQGMNSGVRDAWNLSWKLAAVRKGALGPMLLDTYQRERSPHAKALISFALNIGKVMMPTSNTQATVVQGAFRLSRFVPRVHDFFAQYKYKPKPHYRDGFLQRDCPLKIAGRMAPQPFVETPGLERIRLDDALGGAFAILAVGVEAQTTAAATLGEDFGMPIDRRVALVPFRYNIDPEPTPGVASLRAYDGAFDRFAPPDRERLFLVRPDRYISVAADVTNRSGVADFAKTVRGLAQATWPEQPSA